MVIQIINVMSKEVYMSQPISRVAPFGLRMPDELRSRVQKQAAAERRSVNFIICEVLERAFPPETQTAGEPAKTAPTV